MRQSTGPRRQSSSSPSRKPAGRTDPAAVSSVRPMAGWLTSAGPNSALAGGSPMTGSQATRLLAKPAVRAPTASTARGDIARHLQGQVGNQHLQRLIRRLRRADDDIDQAPNTQRLITPVAEHQSTMAQRDPGDPAPAPDPALAAFLGKDFKKENFHPSTGAGLFDAHYAPSSGALTITVKINFDFQPGDPTNAVWRAAHPDATVKPEQFQWQGDEAEQWKIGPATPKCGPGDFPAPRKDRSQIA